MKYILFDKGFNFKTYFDTETGTYLRTNILDKDRKETNKEPFMASFPHMIDVGVMGHCIHGESGLCLKAGIGCYQSGQFIHKPNMALDDFKNICEQCKGKVTQFALGGRGDPDCHENFEEILKAAVDNQIVPNYTTSGLLMNDEKAAISKKYCGAVGVSWYRSEYTIKCIEILLKHKNKVNIHYVLSKSTIDEAIEILKNDSLPKGINAIIFLLHKPVGQGSEEDVLKITDERLPIFFKYFEKIHPYKVGLDSCLVPGMFNFAKKVIPESVDTCESARFSCCIEPDMTMLPCSFDQEKKYGVNLREHSIKEAWLSDTFNKFRSILRTSCKNCKNRTLCLGGCPIKKQIVLCSDLKRSDL